MKTPLGELLVQSGIITVKTLERALARQQASGKPLGDVLEEMGVVTRDELVEAQARQFGFAAVQGLSSLSIPSSLLELIPEDEEILEAVDLRYLRSGAAGNRDEVNILVVDGSTEVTQELEGALKKEGYQVLSANDGVEGLRIAFSKNPDLILCDATMPRMDGYALMRAIKANPTTAETPMILITSKTSPEEEHRALKSGFHDFIAKPMMTIRVVSRVKRALEMMQQSKDNHLPAP